MTGVMLWLAKAWSSLKLNSKKVLLWTAGILTVVIGGIVYFTGQRRQVALLKAKVEALKADNEVAILRANQELDAAKLSQNRALQDKLDQDLAALEVKRAELKEQVKKLSADEVTDELNKRGY